MAKDEALLLLGRGPIQRALEQSSDPFAADPEAKRSAMAKFQPDALTISRGADWEDRRRFTEAVLDTAEPGSLASLFSEAPVTERTKPSSQLSHWLVAPGRHGGPAKPLPRTLGYFPLRFALSPREIKRPAARARRRATPPP